MRRLVRGAVLVLVVFGVSAVYAGPRDPVHGNPIAKMLKKIVKALGDGLTIPSGKT